MSYSDIEDSATGASPIELYQFIGTYTNYLYTSSDQIATFGGNDYEPLPIQRGVITTGTQADDNVDCQIDVPYDCQLAMDYAYSISPPDLSLKIWRYHRGQDPNVEAVLYWSGQVTNFLANSHTVTIQVPTFFSYGIAGNIPNICYQSGCNHLLFDSRCQVPREGNQFQTTIEAISGVALSAASDFGGIPDDYLRGGECLNLTHNERRMIVAQSGASITLAYPFSREVVAGDEIQVTTGCNHDWATDCKNKYHNQLNHGGFPFIPLVNPFTGQF